MRHRLQRKVFDGKKSPQKTRASSTFTIGKNPHLAKHKLHSKSTYFYKDGSSSSKSKPSARIFHKASFLGCAGCDLRKWELCNTRLARNEQRRTGCRWNDRAVRRLSKLTYIVPSVCALALLIGGIICINPALDNSKAYAEELDFNTTNDDSGITPMANDPTIKLTIAADSGNNNGNVEVGTVAYFSNTITVGGSNITNYSLTLNTTNGTNGDLVGESNAYATVGKVGSNTVPTSFPDNTWGYAISAVNTTPDKASLSYNPVPGTESNNSAFLDYQKNLSGAVNNTYKLVFAAKLGNTMPSDHYQANVYLSAVASATETVENWFRNAGITTMQQMNSTICKSAPENATSQLRDERDSKTYWVTKLKDGNCWMTQNLAYDGGGTQQCDLDGGTSCPGWPKNNDDVARYAQGTHAEGSHTSQGNYYSWEAAMNDICPNKWQLPTSETGSISSKSFGGLTNAYAIGNDSDGSTKLHGDPLYFQYGGFVNNGSLDNASSPGSYWSSTPSGSDSACYLYFYSGYVNPSLGSSGNRHNGMSVRCVAK